MLNPARWVVCIAALISAAWFIFDGAHALVTGAYFRPAVLPAAFDTWKKVVDAVGIDPDARLMHLVFVGYGIVWLLAVPMFFVKLPLTRLFMVLLAFGAAWYVPAGTALCLLQLVLLVVARGPLKA